MNLASIRIFTDDVARLVAFYELLTGVSARWANPVFATLPVGSAELAIAGLETLALGGAPDAAEPRANRSVVVELAVDDVDREFARLREAGVTDFVLEPTTMPWGNRSLLLRDPDGTLVNLFRRPDAA